MSRKNNNLPNKIVNRIYFLLAIVVLINAFLVYRLWDIQIIQGDIYIEKAQKQNIEKVDLNSGRGIIYDRNGKKLTDIEEELVMIVPKEELLKNQEIKELTKRIANIDDKQLYKLLEEQINSSVLVVTIPNISPDIEKELEENDILIGTRTSRYSSDGLLANTIGYIYNTDKVGASGIEKSLDYILKDSNEKYISVFKAGQAGNQGDEKIGALKGSIQTVDEDVEARNIKLTIDKDIQQIIEEVANKEDNPSAIVVSDVNTGEILGMSSRPTFDQNEVAKYNDSKDGELYNRAIQVTYPAGSVFKIVVLYAALDLGIIDENYVYNCTGDIMIGDDENPLRCHNLDGHGYQTLQQAFSNSCNTAFADIAIRVGKENIIKYAERLHLNEKVDIGIEEETYKEIPEDIDIRNLAIGQGSMEFTPLQINQLTQIIANNGTYKPLYLYDSIVDSNQNIVKVFEPVKSEEIISPYTITIIKEMMKEVSKTGTAKELETLEGGCGVKTGTAQSAVNGKYITHGWIVGFYPEDNPQYAITVLVEGTEEESKSAIPIFKEICEKINTKK